MTLKKYLENQKSTLHETLIDLTDFIEDNGSSKNEENLLIELKAKLSIVKEVIKICENRGRY